MKKIKMVRLCSLLVICLIITACSPLFRSGSHLVRLEEPVGTPETGGIPMDTYVEYDSSLAPGSYTSPIEYNTESYTVYQENRFMNTSSDPLSTFAADVNTASYANIRRFLQDWLMPVEDSVRIEEMLNYFHYDYPANTGGDLFAPVMEVGPTPWNPDTQLLHIGLQTKESVSFEDRPANLVFLIDVSGSMEGPDRLDLVKRSFLGLLEELKAEDRISIVTYASGDAVLIDGGSLDDKLEIMTAIENLQASGSTHGSAGIATAYQLAEKHFIPGGNNRIILATDGDLNVGVTSEGDLIRLIEEKRETGVFLSVLGFGSGNLQDNKLQSLANNGNGVYHYIDSIHEARKVLQEEVGQNLLTLGKDVKLQVDFNPYYIKGYRLIGYESRLMEAEDFQDDSKDGGEIGSGHQVTVLYEIIPSDSDIDIETVKSKYDSEAEPKQGLENGELLELRVRYKEPESDTSQPESVYPLKEEDIGRVSDNFDLAAAIAGFGMLLSNSDYSGDLTYDEIYQLLAGLKSQDPYVHELMELVKIADDLSETVEEED